MKYATIILGAVIAIALAVTAKAEPIFFDVGRSEFPKAFQGNWCIVSTGNPPSEPEKIYRRGPCDDSLAVKITARAMFSYDERYSVLVVDDWARKYLIRIWCADREKRTETTNYWVHVDPKGRLQMVPTARNPL